MKKNKISTYILIICLLSLLAVLIVIIQGSYSNLMGRAAKISADPGQSINPQLNTTVIDEIIKRETLEPLPTSPTPIPTP